MNGETATPYDHLWALLWSKDQGALHKEPLMNVVRHGFHCLYGHVAPANDYVLIAVGDRREVDLWADEVRPMVPHAVRRQTERERR